jgi:Kef-type K+ transport system membrane component KefB
MDTMTITALGPILVLLALGVVSAVLSRLVRTSPIVGYLLLGVALNLAGFKDMIAQSAGAQGLASLGVMFLLFDLGLHFSLHEVRERAVDIFGFGSVQVLAGTLGLGFCALLLGMPPLAAFVIGAVLSLSSTAVVAVLIAERFQQNCPVGLTATAILIFQDVASILLLAIVTAFGQGSLLPAIGFALAKTALAFGLAVVAARVLVRPLFDLAAGTGAEEVFTATALFVALAAGSASARMGLSLTLGAFLGGVTLAATPYRPTVAAEIKPFKGLLLGMFFISVGATLDLHLIAQHWIAVVGVTIGFLVVKTLTNVGASLLFRWSVPGSTQLGMLIAQGSEVAFVILIMPNVRKIVGETPAALAIAAVAASLVVTPYLAAGGRALAAAMRSRLNRKRDAELLERELPPVVIVGMGRRGRTVADAMISFGISYSAYDRDSKRVGEANADGYDVSLANIGDPRLWGPVAFNKRRVSVLTAPRLAESSGLTHFAQMHFPNLRRVAAVANAEEAAQFREVGVEPVVDRSDPPGLDLAAHILLLMGKDPGAVANWRQKQRSRASAGADELLAATA